MKTILVLSTLFSAIALPALGALTDADLNKIRLIVTEEIQEEIKPIKADIATLKADMAVMKTEVANLKETFNIKFDNVNIKFDSVNSKFDSVNSKFDDVQNNFDRQNSIIIACIGIPLAILAIGATVWGILAHRRSGKDREQERINQELREEIETLKQQKIVSP